MAITIFSSPYSFCFIWGSKVTSRTLIFSSRRLAYWGEFLKWKWLVDIDSDWWTWQLFQAFLELGVHQNWQNETNYCFWGRCWDSYWERVGVSYGLIIFYLVECTIHWWEFYLDWLFWNPVSSLRMGLCKEWTFWAVWYPLNSFLCGRMA